MITHQKKIILTINKHLWRNVKPQSPLVYVWVNFIRSEYIKLRLHFFSLILIYSLSSNLVLAEEEVKKVLFDIPR